jgi:hypothetical protein
MSASTQIVQVLKQNICKRTRLNSESQAKNHPVASREKAVSDRWKITGGVYKLPREEDTGARGEEQYHRKKSRFFSGSAGCFL